MPRRTPSPTTYDVIIIGGGASGLAAAFAAARAGARTAVVERDVAAGLPILATGNGRCNLSNTALRPEHYRDPAFAREVMGEHPEHDLHDFFDEVGIVTAEEDGRLYPLSRQAASVRDALLGAVARAGADILCCRDVVAARRAGDLWHLDAATPELPLKLPRRHGSKNDLRARRRALAEAPRHAEELAARTVIIACGGDAEPCAELFGVEHRAGTPVLCPVAGSIPGAPHALAALDGIRVHAALELQRDVGGTWRERGEMLFRPYGISGIVAFDLSRRLDEGRKVTIDLVPDLDAPALARLLARREDTQGALRDRGAAWFDGLLARPLAEVVLALSDGTAPAVARLMKALPFEATGTADERAAQVTRGGIPRGALTPGTLALAGRPGLLACGEALDQDADCGGFNLAWAWTSGIAAGRAAARTGAAPR